MNFEYPVGATPLDPDDAKELLPSHITTRTQLDAWEQLNITKAEQWAFERNHEDILSTEFMQALHKRMFVDTWGWAGKIRTKETLPVGSPPERIRVDLANLWQDVSTQTRGGTLAIEEIAARFHHRLVSIHPFPNGNGRLARMMTDLLLVQNSKGRFTWGNDLIHDGEAREKYLEGLRSADAKNYRSLFELLGVPGSATVAKRR